MLSRICASCAELFTENGMLRELFFDAGADQFLRLVIGNRKGRIICFVIRLAHPSENDPVSVPVR